MAEYSAAESYANFELGGINFSVAAWAVFAALLALRRSPDRRFSLASLVATCIATTIWLTLLTIGVRLVLASLDPSLVYGAGSATSQMATALALLGLFVVANWRIGRAATRSSRLKLCPSLPLLAVAPGLLLPYQAIFAGAADIRGLGPWSMAEIYVQSQIYTRDARNQPPQPAPVDVEATWDRQPGLVARLLDEIAPSRPDRAEIYFVGVATYAGQDVFKREATSARAIVDERFGTRGRSAVLINHRDTVDGVPLANATNLEKVLAGIGQKMDREKDVLVLFVTSHGAKGELSVSFSRFGFNGLTTERLAGLLERSGIKNRVIILSACHSGSFIQSLQNPDTLVMTAAHADKTSIGCSNEREWTYFGDAYFNQALRQSTSWEGAFRLAELKIADWEKEQGLPPSEPQMFVGSDIATKLVAIQRQLGAEHAMQAVPPFDVAAPQ